ncbi:MAG: methyltransferase domain-containing protein [Planctomycetaceae bacterium]|nr:methyltransferase domain-containing protein [Planctomycetaceae bacterium]
MKPVLLQAVTACVLLTSVCVAQKESVRPGINDSFKAPDVSTFVERFEKEGREVYDHREAIAKACNIKPGMSVADIGAGTGLFTRLLAPQVGKEGEFFAVDIAKEFVDHVVATSREAGLTQVKGVVCTPTSTELPADSIDLAFICDTYHHFEFPYKTMRSLHNALKDGGKVVLVEFEREEGKSSDWIMGHVRAGKSTFLEEIRLAGFEVESEENFLETSYLVRFVKSNRRTPQGHTSDSVANVKQLLGDGTAVLIDVREQQEWDAGHLQAAKLVPLSELRQGPEATAKLPKNQVIYCHCRSGRRVLAAAEILSAQGFDIRPLPLGFDALVAEGFETAK